MDICIIAAMTRNRRVIGNNGELPWKCRADIQYFRSTTLYSPVIMGRKTYESLPVALRDRVNIVVTRQFPDYKPQHSGVLTAPSLEVALAMTKGVKKVFVIGGAEIYQQALPSATMLYLTKLDIDVEGDTFFPEIPEDDWELTVEQPFQDVELITGTFEIYRRK